MDHQSAAIAKGIRRMKRIKHQRPTEPKKRKNICSGVNRWLEGMKVDMHVCKIEIQLGGGQGQVDGIQAGMWLSLCGVVVVLLL